jgi:cell wall-associated NlpC family hydrolase
MKILQHTILLLAAVGFLSCKDEINATSKTEITNIEKSAEDIQRDSIITFAKQYMGTKYCYSSGNPNKGFDCSGFVNFVYKHFDIEVPRSSSGFKNIGKALKPQEFKKGDVIVFYGYRDSKSIGHVGIVYEANGMKSKFIHASSGKEMAVTISELGSDMYTKRFYKCISIL